MDNIQKVTDLPMETKLTRGEVIDLIIEGLEVDLEKQCGAKEAERDALLQSTFNEVSAHIKGDTKVRLEIDRDYSSSYGNRVKGFTVRFQIDTRSPAMKSLVAQVEALDKECSSLRKMLDDTRHNKGKAKNAILKRFLEATPEGKAMLEQIGNFKVGMQKQLVAALEATKGKR